MGVLIVGAVALRSVSRMEQATDFTVHKTESCGCCVKWVDHLESFGFTVVALNVEDIDTIRKQRRVPSALGSCHTATAGEYTFEGHVPADLIKRVLAERPVIAGLAVPGMPIGSPGMEQPGHQQPYNVIAFDKDGRTSLYATR